MKHLKIEWRHLDLNNKTCIRCSKTGKTLEQVITELKKELEPQGITITFKETKLTKKQIAQSNMVLINDVPIERILSSLNVSKNYCDSCSCITGMDTYCRTIEYNSKQYEEIPEAIIRKAILQAAGINTEGEK